MPDLNDQIRAVAWVDDALHLLDQRYLPAREETLVISDSKTAADAIRDMVVRGAPAIGITAAYAAVLAVRARFAADPGDWDSGFQQDLAVLEQARPTAVNLGWADPGG